MKEGEETMKILDIGKKYSIGVELEEGGSTLEGFFDPGLTAAINYLQKNFPREENVTVHIMEDYDTIQSPDGGVGFGVFVPATMEIYLAGDIPEKEEGLIKTLSHEYKHFLQHCEGKPFDEEEAEAFAEEIYKRIKEIEP